IVPKVVIHPVNALLKDSGNVLPKSLDCIMAHHPLDDMIMTMGYGPPIFEQLFSWVSQDKLEIHQNFALHWQKLCAQPKKLRLIETQLIHQWRFLVKELNPRRLMISQYPSLVLEADSTKKLNECAQKLLQKLKSSLQLRI